MAIEDTIFRLKTIEQFLLSKGNYGATYEEIEKHLEEQFYQNSLSLNFTKRTFIRDKKLMLNSFNTEILVSKNNRYYINHNYALVNEGNDLYDAILLTEAYKQAQSNREIMHFERKKARGFQYLNPLIHAIKNQQLIQIDYISFYHHEADYKTLVVEPYALKAFKYRWYLLANDRSNSTFHIHAYGLDRMKNLEVKQATFHKKEFAVEETFAHVFGIEYPNGKKPENIRLKFDAQQGRYIKALPIHQSQKIIEDTKTHLIIELYLIPSYAFYQELFSMMDRVEVLSPKFVKNEVIRRLKESLKNY